MANNRKKQLEKICIDDPFRRIANAVYERVTDESRPMPKTLEQLAAEIAKEKQPGFFNSQEEKNYFWDCLKAAAKLGGQTLNADDFYEKVLAGREKNNEHDQEEVER